MTLANRILNIASGNCSTATPVGSAYIQFLLAEYTDPSDTLKVRAKSLGALEDQYVGVSTDVDGFVAYGPSEDLYGLWAGIEFTIECIEHGEDLRYLDAEMTELAFI